MPDAIINVAADRITIKASFRFKDLCKSITGGRWDPVRKHWHYTAAPSIAKEIHTVFGDLGLQVDAGFETLLKKSFAVVEAAAHKSAKAEKLKPYRTNHRPEPWLHQKQAFWFAHDMDVAMLAMYMRSGKSRVTVDLAINKGWRKILISCPSSVVNVWPEQFRLYAAEPCEVLPLRDGTVEARMVSARRHMEVAAAKRRIGVVVINHEAIWREPFAKFAREYGFDALIVDEAHRAKQHDGQFSLFLSTLSRAIPQRIALTGTPMPHSPLDIFAQFRFLDPGIFGPSWFRFKQRYCIMGGFQNKQIVRYQNLDELNEKFYSIAFRFTKEQVNAALGIDHEMHEIRTCDLEPKAMRIYADLTKRLYAKLDKGETTVANALVELLRLQQLTGGHITSDEGDIQRVSTAKADLLRDVLIDLGGEPVVIFAQFHEDLNIIQEVTEKLKRTYGEVSGRRKDLTEQATMPEGIDVLGCQIQAGGIGTDLSRAHFGIMWSTGFNLGNYDQAIMRLQGSNQKDKVLFIHLLARSTVDDKVYGGLKSRRNLIESALER